MKRQCYYCTNVEKLKKCTACGALACPEHVYLYKYGGRPYPMCIACYEEQRKANFTTPEGDISL